MVEVIENSDLRNKVHVFDNRLHAGELLADMLQEYQGREDAIILAIPAGGVPVAERISKILNLSWDLAVTRKLHIPWNQEAGFGAVSWDGTVILNNSLVDALGLSDRAINDSINEEKEVIQNRLRKFRGNSPFPSLTDKIAIVVDDGLASGFSMLVTAKTLRKTAKEVIVAVPTSSMGALNLISSSVEKIYCLNIRSGSFFAVADAYKLWYDLTDEDVLKIIKKS